MATNELRLNVPIAGRILDHTKSRVKNDGFASKAEYVRYLIQKDLENNDARQRQIDYFNARIEKSLASGISNKTPTQIKAQIEKTIKLAAKSRNNK